MRKYNALCLFVLSALALRGQNFINGQAARAVIGEYTFTYGGAIPGTYPTRPGQQILGGASGLAWANGILYVADSNRLAAIPQDHRVVMFNTGLIPAPTADLSTTKSYSSYSCNLCGFPAMNQLGQPSFDPPPLPSNVTDPIVAKATTFNPGHDNTAATSNMQEPTAVATDGTIVAVADTDNNRVLIWKSVPTALNQPADLVLGQSNFTANTVTTPPTASTLSGPQGVWIQNGKLLVADTQNFRVLIWNSIPTSNNQPADVVLGQSNFNVGTQAACNVTITSTNPLVAAANELCNPVSVTSDGVHLFVADLGFNRVLIWNHIPTSNGQIADVVVGQPNMTAAIANNNTALCPNGAGAQNQCAATLDFPRYALSDGTRLFIADGGNDRVLIFNTIPTANGASADEVLGEPDFLTDLAVTQNVTFASTTIDNTSGVDVTPTPTSLAYDGTNLYVSDSTNNRVLVFTPGNTPLPNNSAVNWASETIRQEGVVTITGPSTGTGVNIVAGDTATVTIQGTAYTYTIVKADTLDTIAQGLVKAINANSGDPNVFAIFAGTGSGSLYLSSKGINLGFKTISLAASVSNTANLTAIASGNGYLSAGTAATGAPGMLVEINGNNLSDVVGAPATATLSGSIPTSLGGAQVFMDGVATPVYSAVSTRVVSQIPFNFTERNSTSIYVRTTHGDGSVTITNATPIYIAPANPGLFDAPSSPGQPRPWPATGAYHQFGNPQAVVDVEGTITGGNTVTISINGVNHTYTVQSSDSLASVVTGLVNAINSAPDPLATATAGTSFNRVIVVAKNSGTAGNGIPIATSTSSGSTTSLTAYTSTTCCAVVPGSAITPGNPAVPNETIVVSAAGLGQIADVKGNVIGVATGLPYSGPAQNSVFSNDFVSATMGSSTAQVVSAGLPPGSYGVYQVQLIVPSNQATTTQLSIAQNAYVSNIVTIPVGAANLNPNPPPVGSSTIHISIDMPTVAGGPVSGTTYVGGWAADTAVAIGSVTISVDGTFVALANYGMSRPDVCAVVSGLQGCPNVGFYYLLDTTAYSDGVHTIQVTATDANGNRLTKAGTFQTSNYVGSNATRVYIDSPASAQAPYQGLTTFSGWAVNDFAAVSTVQVLIDGVSRGNAVYGDSRPDVCAVYLKAGCPYVGWHFPLDTSTLANGSHNLAISVTAVNGQRNIVSSNFTVANWSTGNPIIVTFDRPTKQSGAFSGVINFGGWALDQFSKFASVTSSIDGIPYGSLAYGGVRNDVCASQSAPECPNVGWNLLVDTTLFGDGAHTLEITAIPLSGVGFTATQNFVVSNMGLATNPTRVFIDDPAPQAPALSGVASLQGWALNDSSPVQTVAITIDGVARGFAQYGNSRPDVCGAYPGRPGCPDVGWSYLLDTSIYANGSHLLQVTATMANGERATASTTFSTQNSIAVSPTAVTISEPGSASNPYQGIAVFSGSALNNTAAITSITVTVDGFPYGSTTPSTGNGGSPIKWTYLINTAQFADGQHTFGVTAMAADGTFAVASATFSIANWFSPSPIRITIDSPSLNSSNFSGVAGFGGWALDKQSAVASVTVAIDDVPYGSASYGGTRNDVCAVNPGYPGCPNVGWNFAVDTTLLANGTHTIAVTATTTSGQSSTTTSSFVVAN